MMMVLAGCGETKVEEGNLGFRPTDTKPLEPMIKQMQETAKTRAYDKPPVVEEKKGSKKAEKSTAKKKKS